MDSTEETKEMKMHQTAHSPILELILEIFIIKMKKLKRSGKKNNKGTVPGKPCQPWNIPSFSCRELEPWKHSRLENCKPT